MNAGWLGCFQGRHNPSSTAITADIAWQTFFPISASIGPAYIGVRWTGLYRRASDRSISVCVGPVYIGMHRTGLYWRASDRPISACIGLAYIGVRRTALYRHGSDRPVSACLGSTYIAMYWTDQYRHVPIQIEVNYSANVQMKDKIIATPFDFHNLPNILKILDKLAISALFL